MSCPHVKEFFLHVTNTMAYKMILNYVTFPKSDSSFAYKASVKCDQCELEGRSQPTEKEPPKFLLACAHCIYFACWGNRHMDVHHKDQPGHNLSICLERGEIYCSECRDFVYHKGAEACHKSAYRMYMSQFGLSDQPWRPSSEELKLLPHIASVVPSTAGGPRPTRGLINMGNTCFLNVVVQALTHTPALRDFLLADLHRCDSPAGSRNCLACEMVRVTQEIYRPLSIPFVPSNLLHTIWLHARHLAGYEQRDAHEFLITLLTLLHAHLVGEHTPIIGGTATGPSKRSAVANGYPGKQSSRGTKSTSDDGVVTAENGPLPDCEPPASDGAVSSSSSSRESGESCDCIVHQVFFGDLESVISYEGCDHRSSTVDPFLDLSLDVVQRGSTSLSACLTSYFRPESIDGLLLCSQCNVRRPAVKQFSLLHLPNVLCFYLKRCHHDTKLTTSITFPSDLDLAPYLTRLENDHSAWQNRYSLYAVLNHSGQTNSGHYTACIRAAPGSWCLCDDQKVVPVKLDYVLNTDAYVLLYHKNLLAVQT